MDMKEWTSLPVPELLTRASCRKDWNRNSAESSSCPPDALIGQETELIEPKDTNYLDEWPNMSTHNFCHQTLNISQSKHKRDDHVLHAFTITVSLISFRPDLPHLLSQFTNDWTKESY